MSSFDFMVNVGLDKAVDNLIPVEFDLPNQDRICLSIEGVSIDRPCVPAGTVGVRDPRIFPTECRQRAATYKGRLVAHIGWKLNGNEQKSFSKDLGEIPIMVKVIAKLFCNLLLLLFVALLFNQ